VGPGLGACDVPLVTHLEGGTEVLGVLNPLPRLPLGGGGPPGHPEGQVRAHVRGRGGMADTHSAHALMRSCLGLAKVQYALRTLPIRHTAAFVTDVTPTQRAAWDAVVGTPASDAAWVQNTPPLSEGG